MAHETVSFTSPDLPSSAKAQLLTHLETCLQTSDSSRQLELAPCLSVAQQLPDKLVQLITPPPSNPSDWSLATDILLRTSTGECIIHSGYQGHCIIGNHGFPSLDLLDNCQRLNGQHATIRHGYDDLWMVFVPDPNWRSK